MSLKAKLEAVIYAAEEPVTLAQLTSLFAEEALQWKPETPAIQETDEELEAEIENESLEYPEPEAAETETTAPETAAQEAEAASEDEPAPSAEDVAAAEAEAKRQARIREREARDVIRQLLDDLIADYAADNRGIEIREIAGGYRMATKPEFHDAVRSFVKSLKPPLKLSLPALETLAVIAYKQPVTAPEVNEIRGVDSSGVFGSLLARKLITTAGRKQVIGRPILYKTTREFLLRFGLKDVSELPSMEEFEKMAEVELGEPEAGEATGEPVESAPDTNPEIVENTPEDASPQPAAETSAEEAGLTTE